MITTSPQAITENNLSAFGAARSTIERTPLSAEEH